MRMANKIGLHIGQDSGIFKFAKPQLEVANA